MYTVYILYSEQFNRLYIGYTSNLLERFKSHNLLSNKGFTVKYRPWKVIHLEYFDNIKEALTREKNLKGGQGREWIRKHIIPSMKTIGFISAPSVTLFPE